MTDILHKYTTCGIGKLFNPTVFNLKKCNFATAGKHFLQRKQDCKSERWSEKLAWDEYFFVVEEMPTEDKAAGRRAAQRRAGC